MATPFQDAAAQASAAVDSVFGEAFNYQPMAAATADVNARVAVDGGRQAATITAVLLDSYARGDSGPARSQGVTAESPGHSSTRPQLSFDRSALAYKPARGDRVTRASDGVLFQVAEVRQPELARYLLDLNRM